MATATELKAILDTAVVIVDFNYPGLVDEVDADAAAEAAAASAVAPDGWAQLVSILDENRSYAAQAATEPPLACPYDGTPLEPGPHGVLHCPNGDYLWSG